MREYKVVSYNLKYDYDNSRKFQERKLVVAKQILSYNADIIGVQEANEGWMQGEHSLPKLLEGYDFVGVGREDGKMQGEFAAIFYKKEQFDLVDSGHFWFSETPEKVSFGWDAACIRICSFASFKNRENGEYFTHYNLHIDHEGPVSREKSIELLLEKVGKSQYPYIITGDFNFEEGCKTYCKLVNQSVMDGKYVAKETMDIATFNNFDLDRTEEHITIDFAFFKRDDFVILSYKVDNSYRYDNLPVSDHYPVIVEFKLK